MRGITTLYVRITLDKVFFYYTPILQTGGEERSSLFGTRVNPFPKALALPPSTNNVR